MALKGVVVIMRWKMPVCAICVKQKLPRRASKPEPG